jgi:hypothetical protein
MKKPEGGRSMGGGGETESEREKTKKQRWERRVELSMEE